MLFCLNQYFTLSLYSIGLGLPKDEVICFCSFSKGIVILCWEYIICEKHVNIMKNGAQGLAIKFFGAECSGI